MINYIKHTEIDKKKWDECVQASLFGIVYFSSWYLDIVSPGWEAIVEDDYQSIFPLCGRKKFGFNYLYQPYFTQQLGLISKNKVSTKGTLDTFLAQIPSKFKLVEINLNTENHSDQIEKYTLHKKRTHHLSLNDSAENIRKKYSENLSRNLKKSIKTEIKIESTSAFLPIIELFKKERGRTIETLKEKEYKTLICLIEEGLRKEQIEIYTASSLVEKNIAGAIFLKSFHSYIFLFSAVGNIGKQSGAMSLIIDHFIEKHQLENKLLDFEGSMDDQLARFYKSFGSQEIVYLQIKKNNLPPIIRRFK